MNYQHFTPNPVTEHFIQLRWYKSRNNITLYVIADTQHSKQVLWDKKKQCLIFSLNTQNRSRGLENEHLPNAAVMDWNTPVVTGVTEPETAPKNQQQL